jgi:hypothetical protein
MKRLIKKVSFAALFIFGGLNTTVFAMDYDPNTITTFPTTNPVYDEILNENFQDWASTRFLSSNPDSCNINTRETNFNWCDLRINRKSGSTSYKAHLYLHNCEVQPFCDTQSGLQYTLAGNTYTNTGTSLGPTNSGVSVGNITILDQNITSTYTGHSHDSGWVVIGEIPYIQLIQYTTSSFGAKRGFRLEYSTDKGASWILIRNEYGQMNTNPLISTSGLALTNSPKGIMWEESVSLKNAMLRFRRAYPIGQLVRLHDLRIYGWELEEDMDDSGFETNSGVDWSSVIWSDGTYLSLSSTGSSSLKMLVSNGILNFSDVVTWARVTTISGQCIRSVENQQIVNLTDVPKGVYLVQACDGTGALKMAKIIR